jgi:propanol-preferring alcohol dehydrogenase
VRALVLDAPGTPLRPAEIPPPEPRPGDVRIEVAACGVCRTDLHIRDGELRGPKLPLVLGHQIVGRVLEGDRFEPGTRVGVPWLAWTCGRCRYCRTGRENLCDAARFTGYTVDGGFAEQAVADARYCLPLPDGPSDVELAPLLCAGLIGYRALRAAGDAERVGLYGFGAAAHVVAQVAAHEGRRVFAFTRPGDADAQGLARELGVAWAGAVGERPEELDAAIIFAPAGELVPEALAAVGKGGTVVCAGIHMTEIPAFPYERLWGERVLRSVANLTRRDGEELFAAVAARPVRTHVETFPLEHGEDALERLRRGAVRGAAVLSLAQRAAVVVIACLAGLLALGASPSASPAASDTSSSTVEVSVYFLRGERLAPAARMVRGPAVAHAAVLELLRGPNAFERRAGLGTAVPSATRLRSVRIAAGTASVDLTRAYASGGGSLSMAARLAQVTYTLTQFPTVRRVLYFLDGRRITTLGGEGLLVDRPQTRSQYERARPDSLEGGLLGPVFVDRPAVGSVPLRRLRVEGSARRAFTVSVLSAAGARLGYRAVAAPPGGARLRFALTFEPRRVPFGGAILVRPRSGASFRIPLAAR